MNIQQTYFAQQPGSGGAAVDLQSYMLANDEQPSVSRGVGALRDQILCELVGDMCRKTGHILHELTVSGATFIPQNVLTETAVALTAIDQMVREVTSVTMLDTEFSVDSINSLIDTLAVLRDHISKD